MQEKHLLSVKNFMYGLELLFLLMVKVQNFVDPLVRLVPRLPLPVQLALKEIRAKRAIREFEEFKVLMENKEFKEQPVLKERQEQELKATREIKEILAQPVPMEKMALMAHQALTAQTVLTA
jgi:hypothetical protein